LFSKKSADNNRVDLDNVAQIYAQASQEAQAKVQQLQEQVGAHWKDTHKNIVNIYRDASVQSAADVDRLKVKSEESTDQTALDASARHVQSVWEEAYTRASKESKDLQKQVDEDWAAFKHRMALVWEQAHREAERKVDELREKARTAAHDAEFEDGSSTVSFKEKIHQVKERAQSATATVVDAAKSGYEQLRDQVTGIYRQATDAATRQLSQLKHGVQDNWETTQSKINKIYHDAASQAESKVAALFKRERADESMFGQASDAAHKAKETMEDWYHQAINAAQRQLGTMSPPPPSATSTWQDLKARILGVYSTELGVVDRRIDQLKQELRRAEGRKKQLEKSTAQAHALSEEEAGTWDLLKTKIASFFRPEEDETTMGRAWNKLKNLWEPDTAKQTPPVSERFGSAASGIGKRITDAWNGGMQALHSITETAGWTFQKLRQEIVHGFEQAFQLVQRPFAELRTKGKEELTPEELEILSHIDAFARSSNRAKIKVTELEPIAGESFGASKQRIVDVYIDELDKESGASYLKDALARLREQLPSVRLGRAQSPQQVYSGALSKAQTLASKHKSPANENWRELVTQLAHIYADEFDKAERQLDTLYGRFEQAEKSGNLPQELRDDFYSAVALHRAARNAVTAAEQLKEVRHATLQDTLERVKMLFEEAIEQAEEVKPGPSTTTSFKRRLRQFLGYDEL
jgi:hypothetical protein